MTTFDQRKDAFENLFIHDETLKFKAIARRNRKLGLWAAAKLGKSGDDANAYASEVIAADFDEAGDGDVIRKLRRDFDAGNVSVSEQEIQRALDMFLGEAAAEVKSEG